MEDRIYRRPDSHLLIAEAPRTLAEIAALPFSAPFLSTAPRGDGHPVIVMPGLGGGDRSTLVIRAYLDSLGYGSRPWRLGRNLGPAMPELKTRLANLLDLVYRESGDRKVSLVGWSLGGVYARLLAQVYPDKIRTVITLGSPFGGSPRSTRAYPLVERLAGAPIEQIPAYQLRLLAGEPLQSIPSTAVFSRTDAIVPWQIATQTPTDLAENVEVYASHTGLGFSPAVLFAIADRLQHSQGAWRPFQRLGWKRTVFGHARLDVSAMPRAA